MPLRTPIWTGGLLVMTLACSSVSPPPSEPGNRGAAGVGILGVYQIGNEVTPEQAEIIGATDDDQDGEEADTSKSGATQPAEGQTHAD